MAITYVGGVTGGRAGSTSTAAQSLSGTLSGGSNTSPLAGDLVCVYCSAADDGTVPATTQLISGNISGAYSNLSAQYADDTYGTCSQFSYQFMGATVDIEIVIPSSGNGRNAQRWVVHVFRNVNSGTPLDVTSVPASGIDTGRPDPAAITPTTAGAWILACYASAAAVGTAYTAPTELVDWLGGTTADTADCMNGAGYYDSWSSGAYNPQAITAGGTTGANDSWTAMTVALRPMIPVSISPAAGTLTVTGSAPAKNATMNLPMGVGSAMIAGSAPTLAQNNIILGTVGTATLTGSAPSLLIDGPPVITPPVGTLAIAGSAPTSTVNVILSPGAGALGVGDPYYASVVLGMHMDGADDGTVFTDVTGKSITRVGNTVTKTATKKFGTASAFFDGTGDSLTLGGTALLDASDFTIEFWMNPSALGAGNRTLIAQYNSAQAARTLFDIRNAKLSIFNGSAGLVSGTTTISTGSWIHVAFVRVGTSCKGYLGGVLEVTHSSFQTPYSTATLFGTYQLSDGAEDFSGYIDDLRITDGVARYTANFTPPVAPFNGFDTVPVVTQNIFAFPTVGALTLTGAEPASNQSYTLSPTVGGLTLTGSAPSLLINNIVLPDAGTLTLTGDIPVVDVVSAGTAIPIDVGTLTLTGSAPTVIQNNIILPDAGALTLIGTEPASDQSYTLSPDAGTLAFAGSAPEVVGPYVFSGEAGVLALFGSAPSVSISSTVEERPSGGFNAGSFHHAFKHEDRKRRLGLIPQEVVEIANEVAQRAIDVATERKEPDVLAWIDRAEQQATYEKQMRRAMKNEQQMWQDAYNQIFDLAVRELLQQEEEAAILLLLNEL